jgi:hypothetical protein
MRDNMLIINLLAIFVLPVVVIAYLHRSKVKMNETTKGTKSYWNTYFLFLAMTVVNSPFLFVSIIILGFNDTGATFSVFEAFLFSFQLMLMPLIYASPIYVISFFIAWRFMKSFHKLTYLLLILNVYINFFIVYWGVSANY